MIKLTKTISQKNTPANTIAIADVQAIVNASAMVKALREKQSIKVGELNTWLQSAQNEVNTEQDKERQQALLQKYNAEFASKKNEIDEQYQQELRVISDNISQTVAAEAKKKGYSMVIAKNIVVCGGDDITEELTKIVK